MTLSLVLRPRPFLAGTRQDPVTYLDKRKDGLRARGRAHNQAKPFARMQ